MRIARSIAASKAGFPLDFLSLTESTSPVGAKDPWGNEKLAFEARTQINRQDFGLKWNAVLETGSFLVGDKIEINLEIQAAAAAEQVAKAG